MDRYEALRHAIKAHAGQLDKCGSLYIIHPISVAEVIEAHTNPDSEWHEDGQVVALLHDVLEDTDYNIQPNTLTVPQYTALVALTKAPEQTYAEYIERICYCKYTVAIIVKLADLWHNLQPERQDCLPRSEAASLGERYLKARQRLWDQLGQEWWPA